MAKQLARHHVSVGPHCLTGLRRMVYGCGRILQGMGLLLMVWILFLFASVAGMSALLLGVLIAAVVFYTGWGCTLWAKKRG
ncbi:hypothetical protein NKDENANG_01267 [Candidatus Entotheonellaceae bacterium PAL068K]